MLIQFEGLIMKSTIWKYTKRTLLGLLLVFTIFLVNLVWFRPIFINHFYEKIFVEFAFENPQIFTGMGLKLFYDELDDNSAEAREKNYQLLLKDLEQLKEYDRQALEGQQALSYDILEWFFK